MPSPDPSHKWEGRGLSPPAEAFGQRHDLSRRPHRRGLTVGQEGRAEDGGVGINKEAIQF